MRHGNSVSYRVAVGLQQGRKVFMIRTMRPLDRSDPGLEWAAKANGFSLHAGVCWRSITVGVGALHRPNAGKARSESPMVKYAQLSSITLRCPGPSDSSESSISISRSAVIAVDR